jgi:acetyl-CoA/propionyl-CoA carboxylase biotin carboxyl carrier protein
MLAKLVVHAEDRDLARARMLRALDELILEGLPTTVPFHRLAMAQPDFAAGTHSTASVEHDWDLTELAPAEAPESSAPTARLREVTVEVEGRRYEVRVVEPAPPRVAGRTRRATRSARPDDDGAVLAPMQGTVVAHAVAVGARVRRGDLLVVLEAMKMENPVVAPRDGIVLAITVEVGASIELGAVLAELGPDADAEG